MKNILILGFLIFFLSACGGSGGDSPQSAGSSGTGNSNLTVGGSIGQPAATPAPSPPGGGGSSPEGPDDPEAVGDAGFFFFSYDDSGSTAAKDLSVFSIINGHLPDTFWGRPYEFLSAENFEHFNQESHDPFDISMGIVASDVQAIPLDEDLELVLEDAQATQMYSLGVNVSGPTLTRDQRPNVVLTLLVDISGSMGAPYAIETRNDVYSLLDVVKFGLGQLPQSLKDGDEVHIVSFDTEAQIVWEPEAFDEAEFISAVESLTTMGSTNLNAGIELAYEVAIRQFDSEKANRVIILTDAFANTGQVNPSIIAENTTRNSLEGIHFAGVGIGSGFNDAFLNELTDIGKSVYSAMITPEDGERIFTEGFMRFIDHAVSDIRFKLTYPDGFTHVFSAAEEVSTEETEVQQINFSYNDSQFFFEMFAVSESQEGSDVFELEIQYTDDENNPVTLTVEKTLEDLLIAGEDQINSALMITSLARLVANQVTCTEVMGSGVFSYESDDALFNEYHALIESYCSIS